MAAMLIMAIVNNSMFDLIVFMVFFPEEKFVNRC